jgi:hypothetical protein
MLKYPYFVSAFWGLFFVDIKFLIQFVHLININKYQNDEGKNGTLLGKPESQLVAPDPYLVKWHGQNDSKAKRNKKPN